MNEEAPPATSEGYFAQTSRISILEKNDRGSQSPKPLSDWDEGVAVIESILSPESNDALSESHKEGLRQVKKLLMSGPKYRRESHVPRELLNVSPNSGSTSDYILAAFAGIHSQRASAGARMLKVVNAHRFVSRMVTVTSDRQLTIGDTETYLLPEWSKLQPSEQMELSQLLSMESLESWGFDIFHLDRLTHGQPLLFIGWAILASPNSQLAMKRSMAEFEEVPVVSTELHGYGFTERFKIPQVNLVNFLREVERHYIPTNRYHNNIHAADVVQSLHALLCAMNAKSSTIGELELFAILLAAVVRKSFCFGSYVTQSQSHFSLTQRLSISASSTSKQKDDVGHPGRSNLFQTNTLSEAALTYNDASVLENMHVSLAFKILHGSEKLEGADIFVGMSEEQARAVRRLVIDAVLATDMVHHFASVAKVKGIHLSYWAGMDGHGLNGSRHSNESSGHGPMFDSFGSEDSWDVLMFALHAADLSSQAKPQPLAIEWTDRCLDEFFEQGDDEKRLSLPISPLCDRETTKRAESQIGFIKFVVAPTYEILGKVFPQFQDSILPLLDANLEYWKQQKQEETEVGR